MSYSKNKQFLLASQRYYKGHQQYNPCGCTDACHEPEPCDPCNEMETCHREKCCDRCGHSVAECCKCDVCEPNNVPQTITQVLCSLINERIQVTTPFDVITGTLLAVKCDYIVILEDTGAQVLVRTEKIELVSPIT